MDDSKMLNENTIGDIILCDPITSKGREALSNLGLTLEEVTPTFFFKHLYVHSKYDADKEHTDLSFDESDMHYQYSVDFEQFKIAKERLQDFNSRFNSDAPHQYPLLILGVAGNGKSIEINRRILSTYEKGFERIYIDLEDSFTKITYGVTYKIPANDALWLICIKLLDEIMKYIIEHRPVCSLILKNFNEIIVRKNLANDDQKQLFNTIGDYCSNTDKETEIFKLLLSSNSEKESANEKIEILLEILMLVMYCANPTQKQYIVFDNIEEYIKLNTHKIQIPNHAITTFYRSINNVVSNIVHSFDRIDKDFGWKVFKIVIALRRTSLGLLDSSLLQYPVKDIKNIADITGYFQISEIWEHKKEYIWTQKLCARYDDGRNKYIIDILDLLMNDGPQTMGTDYQSIIAPLMSYGIRRNARAQAHAAYKVYEILFETNQRTINYDDFFDLMSKESPKNAIRYMFRRALIEIQFKWAIINENQKRWKDLDIGHLISTKKSYTGEGIAIDRVAYQNPNYVTLMRRILTCLSFYHDKNSATIGSKKLVIDMFETVPLFKLIEGVLYNPSRKNKISDEDYSQLAKVLIALSDMSNGDTRSAPYVILGIIDDEFHVSTDEATLAKLLSDIYKAGPKESLSEGKYNFRDFGARITDAGYSFMLDWHSSFSFMAALHCFAIPPLFFLKDVNRIKYVIKTVYDASEDLYKKYENEAVRFCGNNGDFTLKSGIYLPEKRDKYITFKQRMKDLHINHLTLYKTFIENNYCNFNIFEIDLKNLLRFISDYIEKYKKWETGEGARECF